LGEDVEETGAGLEELAGEAGGLDEDDDEQPANARVAKQASAAAHLVRELPNLTITVVPSNTIRALIPSAIMTTGAMSRLHTDEGAPDGATPGGRRLGATPPSTGEWATRTPMNSREGNQRPFGRNELGSGGEVRGDLGGR
jgi:hypothetical protein